MWQQFASCHLLDVNSYLTTFKWKKCTFHSSMFSAQILGLYFHFFHILTSPLNSFYLYSFGGLFYLGWKINSFFFLLSSLMALLSFFFFQPCSNPIVSLPWFFLVSISSLPPYYPLFSPVLTYPLIPLSPWMACPLPVSPFLLFSASLFHFCFDLLTFTSLFLSSLHFSHTFFHCLLLTFPLRLFHYALFNPIVYYNSIFLCSISSTHTLSPSLPLPITSLPLNLLLLNFSHLTQSPIPKRHVSKQRSAETKSWQSLGICPPSPFCLLIYSFVCIPLTLPLSFRLWCV